MFVYSRTKALGLFVSKKCLPAFCSMLSFLAKLDVAQKWRECQTSCGADTAFRCHFHLVYITLCDHAACVCESGGRSSCFPWQIRAQTYNAAISHVCSSFPWWSHACSLAASPPGPREIGFRCCSNSILGCRRYSEISHTNQPTNWRRPSR